MSFGEMLAWSALGLSVVFGILLLVQTMRLGRIERQLRALVRGAGPGAASASLGDLISRQGARLESNSEQIETLHRAAATLNGAVARSVQCVGIVRYNPFQETGGDQSFALALLTPSGDGVVISSLHTRTATRFYAKPVKAGNSPLSLSDEELQAVHQAMEQVKQP